MQHMNQVAKIIHCMVNQCLSRFLIEEFDHSDCQGKVCLYNGTLDLNTCECQCSDYARGTECEQRKWITYL